jgi:hypothetical protein
MLALFEILQNVLVGIPPVARFAARYHGTGLNGDRAKAREVLRLYCRFQPVVGKDVLEIGRHRLPIVRWDTTAVRFRAIRRCLVAHGV